MLRRTLRSLVVCATLCSGILAAQPCLVSYTFTASPLPTNGTYGCGETVTFCYTVTNWNTTNANWFHGLSINIGPGWDAATLVPGPPPATLGGSAGTWGWYNSVSGTAGTAIGAQGPGYFFDLNSDGNPGNNFGDFANGPWQFCWTVSVLSGAACVNGLDLSVSVNSFGDSETGSWGSAGCGGDATVVSPPAVIQSCVVDAGIGGPLVLCSSGPPADLLTQLGGTPDAGGVWTDPGGAPHSGIIDPAVDVSGAYTYTVTSVAPPCSGQSVMAVTIETPPDPGIDASHTVCASEPPFSMLGMLGGTPGPSGTWTIGALPVPDSFDPATGLPGVYTYDLIGTAPCPNASSTLTIVVNPTASAGANGALTTCSDGAVVGLIASLGGAPDPGGTWTGPDGLPSAGVYDPFVSAPGLYTYTVAAIAPCPDATATVIVTENALPNAGLDATAVFCGSQAAVPLLSMLGGTPDPGGTWTFGGAAVGPSFDPATDASGVYTYDVAGIAPCPSAQAMVSITVNELPEPGGPGAISVCSSSAVFPLFDVLSGAPEAGGTWTGPDGNATSGQYTPGTSIPGAYVYEVIGTAPCPNATATVNVTENDLPNAGLDGGDVFCSTAAPTLLFALLGGTPDVGGVWTDPDGLVSSGTIDPGAGISGTYTYSVSGAAPCPSDQSNVTITIVAQEAAGTDGAVNLCEGSAPTDLFSALGGSPSPVGSWTDPNGNATDVTFDPDLDVPGNYTYTVIATVPCLDVSATVQVSLSPQPNAGNDAVVSVCSDGADLGLFDQLGPSALAGGAWTGPDGTASNGTYVPSISVPGVYTYTIVGLAPCITSSAYVTVNEVQSSDPGANATLTACSSGAVIDLFSVIGGTPDPGGSWSAPGGVAFAGSFDPAVNIDGDYTYTLVANGPCPAVSGIVTMTVLDEPDAGTDGTYTYCSSAQGSYALINGLLGSPQAGGQWTAPNGLPHGPNLSFGTDPVGIYTYTISAPAPCTSASSTVLVAEVQAVNAGIGGAIALCENDAPVDPSTWLGGMPTAGGTWTGPSGAVTGTVDPDMDIPGNYTYTVAGSAPCPNAQAVVVLTIATLPDAGGDGTVDLCADATPLALFGALDAAGAGGSWSGPSTLAVGVFNPSVHSPGSYTYTLNGNGACAGQSDASVVVVTVSPLPTPSFTSSEERGCLPLLVQYTLSNSASLVGAQWYFGDGASGSGVPAGVHTYTQAGTYATQVVVTDVNGCVGSAQAVGSVLVSAGSPANFGVTPERVSVEDPVADVLHSPRSQVSYVWTVDGETITPPSGSFQWTFDAWVGQHPICLEATDTLGCVNINCSTVLVDDVLTVFSPNAFTPNGDGINDTFLPSVIGLDTENYSFIIFDRWGNEVFNTTDHTEAWNGAKGNSGDIQQQDVYVWRILARDQFSAERKEVFGTATLIR